MATTLSATTADELEPITIAVHDSYFEPDDVVHDLTAGTFMIPFAQEAVQWEDESLPQPVELRRTWLFTEERVPFMAAELTIHHVTSVEDDDWLDFPMLVAVRYDERRGTVEVSTTSGRLKLAVERLHVTARTGHEVVKNVRRRTYRLLRAESDREM